MRKKRNSLLIIFLFLSTAGFSQSTVYHPLPDSNAQWQETAFWLYPGPPITPVYSWYTVFTEGDTLINSVLYTKLYETGAFGAMGPQIFYAHEYKGAYRQDTALKRVYSIPASYTTESLLYDFNLSVGDTLNTGNWNTVLEIDSVLVGTVWHKRFLLNDLSWGGTGIPDTNYALIEGVGSTRGLLQPIVTPFENGSQLECFSHFNTYYPANITCPFFSGVTEPVTETLNIYPNPATEYISFPSSETGSFEIFNMLGKRVLIGKNTTNYGRTQVDVTGLVNGLYFVKLVKHSGIFLKM